MYSIFLPDEACSAQVAEKIAPFLDWPLLIGVQGDLGMGKTTLIRALLQALGVQGKIKSPTYSLLELYQTTRGSIAHLDCYRLADFEELEFVGFRDLFDSPHLILIEWPEMVHNESLAFDMIWQLTVKEQGRELIMCAKTSQGEAVLKQIERVTCDL